MTDEPIQLLEVMRRARRSASDQRKVFLALYGLLIFVPVLLLILATGRAVLHGDFGAQLQATFFRPVLAAGEFGRDAVADGRWGLLGGVLVGAWLASRLIGSFFGLAVTRMAAIELTCQRRAEVKEALGFSRKHWHWAFLTPVSLFTGAALLIGLAALIFTLGRWSELLLVVASPVSLVLAVVAVILIAGLLSGGILAWPTIATEWSDAFDAITRVYGYGFAHAYRLLLYRLGGAVAMCFALVSRCARAALVLGLFGIALVGGLGRARTAELLDGVLLEPPEALPFPQTVAGWAILSCVAVYLTMLVARLLVFGVVLRQAIYLLLRLHIDKVPFDNIDGYRPDDSAYDPTAQGFELVEVEEEIPAE